MFNILRATAEIVKIHDLRVVYLTDFRSYLHHKLCIHQIRSTKIHVIKSEKS